MERLIHKPDGSLVTADPFHTLGAILSYKNRSGMRRVGLVTEDSLKRWSVSSKENTNHVWAEWIDIGTERKKKYPTRLSADDHVIDILKYGE